MTQDVTHLPPMGYSKLKQILVGYFAIDESASLEAVAQSTNFPKGLISKSHAFLSEIGIITGDKLKKKLTIDGENLGRAIKYDIRDDIKRFWQELIHKNEFLYDLVLLLFSKDEMFVEDFIMQTIYRSKDKNRLRDVKSGARTVMNT